MTISDKAQPRRAKPRGPNKTSVRRQREVAASGQTPLDYMLRVMRDPRTKNDRRDWAAAAAAPYVHPKLATLQSNVNLTGRLTLEALINASLPSPANDTMKLIEGEVADEELPIKGDKSSE